MKKWIAIVLAAVMLLTLAGCADAQQETQPTQTVEEIPTELGSRDVTVTFWHCASEEAGVLMEKYVQQFNAENGLGITVVPVYQGQYADATTLVKAILSAGNVKELPDVLQMDSTGKLPYYHSGCAYTVDRALEEYPQAGLLDSYLTGALGNWQFSGSQLGLPFATSTTVTYCNMDLLKQAGWDKGPDTLADVAWLYADMLSAGLTAKALQAVPNTPTLANWLGQLGSFVVDQSNGADGMARELVCLENGALETFLTAWKDLYASGGLLNENSSTDKFVAGEVALMTASSSNLASVLGKVDGKFSVGVAPYLRVNGQATQGAGVSGSCLVMFDSQDALRRAAAWEFVRYMTSAEIQADFAAGTGYIPAHKDALKTETYTQVTQQFPQYKVAFEQLANTPAGMRSVTVGPATDFYYAIIQGVSDMLEYDMTPAEAAQAMAEELNLLLEDYARTNG